MESFREVKLDEFKEINVESEERVEIFKNSLLYDLLQKAKLELKEMKNMNILMDY